MFEMAMSFNAQQIQFRPVATNNLLTTSERQAEIDLIRLFSQDDLLETLGENGRPWSGAELCDQLRCRFSSDPQDMALCKGSNFYDEQSFQNSSLNVYQGSSSKSKNFELACVLNSVDHRILINPNVDQAGFESPYRLYSCTTSRERTDCLFERDP